MPRLRPLPQYDLSDLEPLPEVPAPTTAAAHRPPPTRSAWQRLLRHPVVEHNAAALAADLRPMSNDGRRPAYRRKRIVICADGTWNAPAPARGEDRSTNVWRLYRLVKDRADDGTPQLKFYHAGVGTGGSTLRRVVDGASGRGLGGNMQECYEFLARHYHEGDAVYLFGFSRGAFTVRSLAGLIRNCGVVDLAREAGPPRSPAQRLQDAYALYRDRDPVASPVASRAVQFRHQYAHPDFHLACIGVWDTVGALGVPLEVTAPVRYWNHQKTHFHDVTLSSYVDCAFHALALDETREAFTPTLWVQQPHAKAAGQILEQMWFAGAHADVGGGYGASERGLADVALRWMVNRVADTCRLEFDPCPLSPSSGAGYQFAVHDSTTAVYRAGTWLGLTKPFARTVDGGLCADGGRDAERVITEALHPSVEKFAAAGAGYAPANVSDYLRRRGVASGEPELPAPQRDRRRATTAADVDAITLERTAGAGRPASVLTLTRDGRAEQAPGSGARRRGAIGEAAFRDIAQRLVDSPFFGLADRYGSPRSGAASVIRVTSGRRSKSVASYDRSGPGWLDDLERAIGDAERGARWDSA